MRMKSFPHFVSVFMLLAIIIGCKNKSLKKEFYLRKCIGQDSCGYTNDSGAFIIKPGEYKVCYTDTFKNLALVSKSGEGYIAINKEDKKLFTVLNYDNGPDELKHGLFRIVEHDKIGFANMDGTLIIPATHKWVEPFSGGLAAYNDSCIMVKTNEYIAVTQGKWGYIDLTGKIVIPAKFDKAGPFISGKTVVFFDNKEFSIDTLGNIINK